MDEYISVYLYDVYKAIKDVERLVKEYNIFIEYVGADD